MGRRRAARKQQPSHLVTGLVLGLILGAGLAVGVLMAQRWSGERASWGPAAPRHPAPAAPRAVAPAAPPPAHLPALPAQNPEESQAPAVVQIPAILVETAFISNPREEQMLRDPSLQQAFAQGILKGIQRYLAAPQAATP